MAQCSARQQHIHASCVVESTHALPQQRHQQQQQSGTRTLAAAVSGARLAAVAAVLLVLLWVLSAHQVLAGLRHHHQHHSTQIHHEQQPSQACNLTFSHQDIARLAAHQYRWESPFIDTQGMKSSAWERVPEAVWPPLGPGALALWQELQPHLVAAARHSHLGRTSSRPGSSSGGSGGDNAMFNACDSAVLYALARVLQPSRVIEVGSGFSTHMLARALQQNAREAGTVAARHTCIEPHRSQLLQGLPVEVVQARIQDVDLALFDELGAGAAGCTCRLMDVRASDRPPTAAGCCWKTSVQPTRPVLLPLLLLCLHQAGDLLFLDNSHVTRPYGDVVFEFLYILPRLRPGVVVHIHDVFLPYEYPMDWMLREVRPYTEQYMLAALL